MYHGKPIDLRDRPPELGRGLGSPFCKAGDVLYTVADGKMSIFDLPKNTTYPNEDRKFMELFPHFSPDFKDGKEKLTAAENLSGSSSSAAAPHRPPPPPPPPPLAHWVAMANGSVRRASGVRIGKDLNGGDLFVGRAHLLGCLVPGKIAVDHGVCYVAWDGREYGLPKYEMLVVERGKVEWVPCRDGYVPPNALPCGYTVRGETMYSVRAPVENILTPGHIVKGENKCHISYNLEELSCSEYEALTIETSSDGDGGEGDVHDDVHE